MEELERKPSGDLRCLETPWEEAEAMVRNDWSRSLPDVRKCMGSTKTKY